MYISVQISVYISVHITGRGRRLMCSVHSYAPPLTEAVVYRYIYRCIPIYRYIEEGGLCAVCTPISAADGSRHRYIHRYMPIYLSIQRSVYIYKYVYIIYRHIYDVLTNILPAAMLQSINGAASTYISTSSIHTHTHTLSLTQMHTHTHTLTHYRRSEWEGNETSIEFSLSH